MDNSAVPKKILDQTLEEVISLHPQAQELIIKAMHITPEKFNQLHAQAKENALMQTKIGDLFKSGSVANASAQTQLLQQSAGMNKESFVSKCKKWFMH